MADIGEIEMATNEDDRTVSDQDIRKHVAIIFNIFDSVLVVRGAWLADE